MVVSFAEISDIKGGPGPGTYYTLGIYYTGLGSVEAPLRSGDT